MDKLTIRGGTRLAGEVTVSGAKNAALPILAASLLTADELIIDNVPQLQDVSTTLKLLRQMGVAVEQPIPRCGSRRTPSPTPRHRMSW